MQEETMFVSKLQPKVNTNRGLPIASTHQGERDERLLIADAKSGHGDAFGELYKRHHHKAYRSALRILRNQQDAEDAVQRAFHRALVNLQCFREDSTFSTWLTRIVINESLMLLRQRRTQQPLHENGLDAVQIDDWPGIANHAPTPEEILCENERRAALHRAIRRLRNKHRIVVFHREFQGLTNVETARRLGLTVSAVKARTFHARRFLRKYLQQSSKRTRRPSKLQCQTLF
jgi:RNA polymerase sigma-70 factor, ECF subfamily